MIWVDYNSVYFMIKEAIKILIEANSPSRTITRDTEVFASLLKLLDHPERSFKSVHVTGTNGKGSVSLKTAYILEKAGYKTGLYTSPHLFTYLERIKINRNNIDEKFFSQSILKLRDISQKNNLELTFFEYLTATGFLYFKEERCDFASIQVGLGGRYDTTNVIKPQISIITSIGIDHEKILGYTREQIAKDKAGIIKEETPVVIGPHANLIPILEEAKIKAAPLHSIKEIYSDFQQENNALTRAAINILRSKGYKISDTHIEEGLLIKQPCRMEQLPIKLKPKWAQKKRFFFDVGHNPNAIERMLEYYKKNIKKQGQKLIVLFGSSKDKNTSSSLKKLEEVADIIFFIQPNHPRAMNVNEIAQYVGYSKYPHKFRILDDGKIKTTMTLASGEQNHSNVIICGSFFLMPEAWGFFDPKYLNESDFSLQEQYKILANDSKTPDKQ